MAFSIVMGFQNANENELNGWKLGHLVFERYGNISKGVRTKPVYMKRGFSYSKGLALLFTDKSALFPYHKKPLNFKEMSLAICRKISFISIS